MNLRTATIENFCPRRDIAAYVDGELRASEELALEIHFAGCASCAAELNEQKKLLCALDFALEDEKQFELPANFTKVVVANAESKVSGLRQPKERVNALLVCAALFLLTLLGLGSQTEAIFSAFVKFSEQFFAVAVFAAHLIGSVALGIFVIVRSLSYQFVFGSTVSSVFVAAVFFVSLAIFSRLIVRFNRV